MKFTALLNVLMKNSEIVNPVLKSSKIVIQVIKMAFYYSDWLDRNDGNIINQVIWY